MNGRAASSRAVCLSFLLLALPLSMASAQQAEFPTVPYALLENSTYQQGCFEPCDCPILEEQLLEGTFDLVFYPFEGPLWTAAVEQIDWKVPTLQESISGSGTYIRAGDLQRLQVDLAIDDEPATSFDSGWVEGGDVYPEIDVTITMNQFFCYDVVMRVHAAPALAPILAVARTHLSWTAMAGDPRFDVVCGDLTVLRDTGDFYFATDLCLANDRPETTLPYSIEVDAGGALWFLVREDGGTYDADLDAQPFSRDPGIDAAVVSCP